MKRKLLGIGIVIILLFTNYAFAYSKTNGAELSGAATVIGENTELDSKYSAISKVDSRKIDDLEYGESTDGSNIVAAKAVECHKYLRENGYTYGGNGVEIPDGIYNQRVIDCSAYVSWVLYCAGCNSFKAHQEIDFVANCAAGRHPELEEVSNKNDVQPGDVLVYRPYGGQSGHVELAAQVENGKVIRVYNCGSDYSISSTGTTEYPETSSPAKDIADYSENKIYRVKNNSPREIVQSSYGNDILYDYLKVRNNVDLYLYNVGKNNNSQYIQNNHYKTIEINGLIELPNGIIISNSVNDKLFREYGVTSEQLKKYNKGNMEFKELSIDTIETIFNRMTENIRENTKSKIDSNILKELTNDQINALTAVYFKYNNIGNFNEVYKLYKNGNSEEFKNNFKVSNKLHFIQEKVGLSDWEIFNNGRYLYENVVLDTEEYASVPIVSLKRSDSEVTYSTNKQFYLKDKENSKESSTDRYCTIKISRSDGKEIDLSTDGFFIKYSNAISYNGEKYNLKLNINKIKREVQEDCEIYFRVGRYNKNNEALSFNPGIGTSNSNDKIEVDTSIEIVDDNGNSPNAFSGTMYVSAIDAGKGIAINCENPKNTILMESNLSSIKYSNSNNNNNQVNRIENFDNFLFIGDSGISAGAVDLVDSLGNDINILAIGGSRPSDWTVAKTAGETYYIDSSVSACAEYVTFPEKKDVKGISTTLGANGLSSEINSMKTLLNNLLNMYPGVPIFVNGVTYVGPRYTYFDYREFNAEVDELNNAIKPYCESKDNLYYVDVSNGLYKDGALNSAYGDENDLEFNAEGNRIFVNNIREGILNTDLGGTGETGDNDMLFIYSDSDSEVNDGAEIYIKKDNSSKMPVTFTFDKNESISSFGYIDLTKQYHKITTSVENGTISSSVKSIKKGKDKTIIYKPKTTENSEKEYFLDEIKIDNVPIDITSENENSYTFKNINADHSISVSFTQKYTVRFDTKGGNEIGYETIKPGEKASDKMPERRGYDFTGWYKDEQLKERYDFSSEVNSDLTLYAGWRIKEYNIQYNLNGGTNNTKNPSKYTVEDEVIFEQPNKTGYEFKGWYEDEGLTKQISSISKGNIGDKNLYAKWEKVGDGPNDAKAKYTVEHYLENVEGKYEKDSSLTETYDGVIGTTVEAKKKTFAGYEENQSYSERIASGEVKEDGSLKLKLFYNRIKYQVSFDVSGGKESKEGDLKTQEVKYDTKANKPSNPTKEGYEFEYWYYEENGKIVKFDFEKTVVKNIKLTAKWKAKRYKISYELYNGTNSVNNPEIYTVEKEEKFEAPTREGYEFKGWYEDENFTRSIESTKGKTGDITLYAKWEMIQGYSYNNDNNTDNYSTGIETRDSTISNKILPNTGIISVIILGIFISVLLAVFGIRYYFLKNIMK